MTCEREHVTDDGGRPNFRAFVDALRTEASGTLQIHRGDRSGQAASDARRLEELARRVGDLARDLGYL